MMARAVQSWGVIPLSMPIWLRNGPAWTHNASTTMKRVESASIRRCGRNMRRRLMPDSRIRWVNDFSDASRRASPVRSGSSARSFSTPWRISHGIPANGRPLPGLPGEPPTDPPIGAPPVMVPPPHAI